MSERHAPSCQQKRRLGALALCGLLAPLGACGDSPGQASPGDDANDSGPGMTSGMDAAISGNSEGGRGGPDAPGSGTDAGNAADSDAGKGEDGAVPPPGQFTWKTMRIGAGGLITGIDVGSDGTTVIRTDTYGGYIWSGTQWQQLVTSASMPATFVAANFGNAGQGVYEIRIDPNNTSVLYMTFDGFVFKSTNKGTTWAQTSFAQVTANPNGGGSGMGKKMAVDPNNSNVIYAGSANGLFVTNDGGATWASVSAVPVGLANVNGSGNYSLISGIVFDPAIGGVVGGNTQTVFVSSS